MKLLSYPIHAAKPCKLISFGVRQTAVAAAAVHRPRDKRLLLSETAAAIAVDRRLGLQGGVSVATPRCYCA